MKELYVELTAKLRDKLDKQALSLPNGVIIKRKKGSRACHFECEDEQFDGLVTMCENLGLAWQDMSNEDTSNG